MTEEVMMNPKFRKFQLPALGVLGTVIILLIAMMPAHSASTATAVQYDWAYSAAQNRIVSSNGGSSFTLKGGTAVTSSTGQPGIRFTAAPSLATYSTTSFPVPDEQDFSWMATVSVDKIYPKSSANITQMGLWNGHQIKMQLDAKGVPQCVFNGTNGRLMLTSNYRSSLIDGKAHSISCWRSGNSLGVSVDGTSNSEVFAIGNITPTGKPTIGSKSATADSTDQFFGTFWGLSVTIGNTPTPSTPEPSVPEPSTSEPTSSPEPTTPEPTDG